MTEVGRRDEIQPGARLPDAESFFAFIFIGTHPDAAGPQILYVAVANHIAARIAAGELAPDGRLPGERDLAAEYEVSVTTVHHAVGLLRGRGLVVSRAPKGTYVVRQGQWRTKSVRFSVVACGPTGVAAEVAAERWRHRRPSHRPAAERPNLSHVLHHKAHLSSELTGAASACTSMHDIASQNMVPPAHARS